MRIVPKLSANVRSCKLYADSKILLEHTEKYGYEGAKSTQTKDILKTDRVQQVENHSHILCFLYVY